MKIRKTNCQGDQEKIMWDFQGFLFLALEFPSKGSKHNFVEYQGLSCVLSGISRGKVKNKKFQGGFQEKYILNPSCLDFFWNSPFKQTNQVQLASQLHILFAVIRLGKEAYAGRDIRTGDLVGENIQLSSSFAINFSSKISIIHTN